MSPAPPAGWESPCGAARRRTDAIRRGAALGEIYAEPAGFPRSLFIRIANKNWERLARKNGLAPEELYRRL